MLDVTIIGAGPAGSLAAFLLARGGCDVTLIEQHRFPRDKVCGECLSALGIDTLRRAGLSDRLEQQRPVKLRRAVVITADGREAAVRLPQAMWGLSRRAMDQTLLQAAADAGARLMQPARCELVQHAPLRLTVRELDDNRVVELRPELVLLADGKAALAVARPSPTGDLGVKTHFRGVDDAADAITLFGLRGHYVGLAPIEDGLWNLAMSVPAEKVKRVGGSLEQLLERAIDENPALARRLHRAQRVGAVLASPLPRYGVAARWPEGIIPIGNAAAALEPIGGEGMGLALRSAELVCTELLAAAKENRLPDAAMLRRRMHRLWSVRRHACRAGGLLLSHPRSAAWVTRLAKPLGPAALRLVGK